MGYYEHLILQSKTERPLNKFASINNNLFKLHIKCISYGIMNN